MTTSAHAAADDDAPLSATPTAASREERIALYAALTRRLCDAALALDLEEASRLLEARQRLIDESRSVDGAGLPLSPAEVTLLQGARDDEAKARGTLDVERKRYLELFQGVAKVRRAHGGYAGASATPATSSDRTA